MNLIPLALMIAMASPQPGQQPGPIQPITKLKPATLSHRGDKRSYLIYPGKRVGFAVKGPATVEVAVRAVFLSKKKRARLRLRLRSGGQILLDQSQSLGTDRHGKSNGRKVSRPLVGVADLPEESKKFWVDLQYKASEVSSLIIAVTALQIDDIEIVDTSASTDQNGMVPDLVSLGPVSESEPSLQAIPSGQNAPTEPAVKAEKSTATSAVPSAAAYHISRYVGVDLAVQFGLGIPGADLSLRYYLPFLSERISFGARLGYDYVRQSGLVDAQVMATELGISLHLLRPALFVEAELWRSDAVFFAAQAEAGAVPFWGTLTQRTLLAIDQDYSDSSELSGLTWYAGGAVVAGLALPAGHLVGELGYRYAPNAVASDSRDPRRSIEMPILGMRLGLGYRFSF